MCATAAKTDRSIVLFDVSPRTYKGIVKALGDRPFRLCYDGGTLQLESSILRGVDWRTYSKLVHAFGDRHFRHTYQEGTLEIMMSPSIQHERIKGLLAHVVKLTALECDIWIMSVGSATRRAKMLSHGLEPDESFHLGRRPSGKKGLPGPSTPPDLAIEVDLRRPELERARSYAKLGVTELWACRHGSVLIRRLSPKTMYVPVERSGLLPLLTADHLTRLVKQMFESDETSTLRGFAAWLRKEVKKITRSSRKKET